MRRIATTLTVLLALWPAPTAFAREATLTLTEATRLALASSPEIRALDASVAAARARRTDASLPLRHNPTLTTALGPRNSPLGESLDYTVELLQPIEIAGQRGARVEAAVAALHSAEARLRAMRVEVAATTQETFGRAIAAEKRLALADEAVAIAREALLAAEERYRAGATAALEANTARVELGRAVRDRAESEHARGRAYADLHMLIGADPLIELSVTGDFPPGEPLADAAAMVQEALANRPEVAAARHDLEAAQADAKLAAREWIPNPKLGASVSREEESGTSITQGLLSFDLPLFNRQGAARGVAAARVAELEAALDATQRRIAREALTARSRALAAQTASDGFTGDVDAAIRENLTLVTESYRAGKIDFLELVIIRRQAVEAQREFIDVQEELNAARAGLMRALGRNG